MLRVIVFWAFVRRGFGSGSECASSHSSLVYAFPNRCMKFESLFSNTGVKGGPLVSAAEFAVAEGWTQEGGLLLSFILSLGWMEK